MVIGEEDKGVITVLGSYARRREWTGAGGRQLRQDPRVAGRLQNLRSESRDQCANRQDVEVAEYLVDVAVRAGRRDEVAGSGRRLYHESGSGPTTAIAAVAQTSCLKLLSFSFSSLPSSRIPELPNK